MKATARGIALWLGLGALTSACTADATSSRTGARASAIDTGRWTELSPVTSPPARMDGAMAWDSARHRLVLFGGASSSTPFADTWEWDGHAWTDACSSQACRASSPPARTAHAMAYDEARHVTVLFGGDEPTGGGDFDDTWEWDGTSWTQRCTDATCAATKPAERHSHGMAYHPERQRVMLAGGNASGYLPETWEWDGSAWTQLVADGPFKISTVLAYDTKNARMLALATGSLSSVYAWDGSAWAKLDSSASPPLRMYSAATYDAAASRLVVFGGLSLDGSSDMLGDTWEWDGTAWALATATGPAPRMSAMLGFDGAHVVLFGGRDDLASQTTLADTWRYVHLGANGAACATSDECGSSNCLAGVCCEAGCHGSCTPAGTCLAGLVCDGDHTLRDAVSGATQDCAPYRCETGGTCAKTCGTIDDCTGGTVCDTSGHCVESAAAPSADEGGGCSMARGDAGRGRLALALGLVVAAWARCRRGVGA